MDSTKYSERIADFLNFLREAQQEYNIAMAEEAEANNATQDILHTIELRDNKYHDYARLSIALRDIRQQRRRAKNRIQALQPIVDMAGENAQTIKAFERVLGEVRKAERNAESRVYTPRTDIAEWALAQRKNK